MSSSQSGHLDGLAPLPNIFDPEAMSSSQATNSFEHPREESIGLDTSLADLAPLNNSVQAQNDDTEAITADEPGMDAATENIVMAETDDTDDEGPIIVAPASPMEDTQARVELGEEIVETEEDRPEINSDLFGFLKTIQDTGEEEVEEKVEDEDMETALSSPMSDLPDLPSELPPSPEPPTPPSFPAPPAEQEEIASIGPGYSNDPLAPVTAADSATEQAPASAVKITPLATAAASSTKAPGKRSLAQLDNEGPNEEEEIERNDAEGSAEEVTAGPSRRSEVRQSPVKAKPRLENVKRIESDDSKSARSAKKRKVTDPLGSPSSEASEQKDKNIRAPRSTIMTDIQLKSHLKGQTREVQLAPCLRPRYAKWGKCTQCVSKIGGDSCRFREYRIFRIDPETADIMGLAEFESTVWKEAMTSLPKTFNVPFTEDHMKRIERTVSPMLLPLITRELRHVVRNEAIQRGTDAARHRAVCDFCSSTIFGGWFFCKKCGRDYCLVCERYFSDSDEKMGQSPWHLPDAARPRLLRCTPNNAASDEVKQETGRQKRGTCFHFRPDLQPVSRFSEDELRQHWISLAEFVLHSEGSVGERLKLLGLSGADDETVSQMQDWLAKLSHGNGARVPAMTDEEVRKLYTKRTHPVASVPDPAEMEDKNQEFIFIPNKQLTLDVFDQLWARGEPIVVDKVGDELKMSWTPDDFIKRFGKELCVIIDCQTNDPQSQTLKEFFEIFKDPENRSAKVLKLKDWPQTNEFAETHPDLYNDFCNALPVPDFTRREGVLNLYAHFPPGPTRPDIGPKMYNAFAAKETPGGQGSTRLHLDVADAVNVMLYASDRADGQPGCAVWDLFRAEDADKIRMYLKKKFDKSHKFTDPIHSQLFYLDSNKRKELAERYGVVSWRVYQYPGQAVFIPAGCAHQVCNLADCIKIALDFVSPHNVTRCQQLTQDFRTENFVKAWKEDVLQLYNVLWYAWTNVGETRQRRVEDEKSREEEVRQRKAHLDSLAKGDHEAHPSSPFASSFSDRARAGLLSAAVSSIRDEENTRSSPAPIRSGTSSPSRRDGHTPVRAESPGIATELQRETDMDRTEIRESGIGKEDSSASQIGDKSATHVFAEKLLIATLLASESAPPPEARAPSAATKWGGSSRTMMNAPTSVKNRKPLPMRPNLRGRKDPVAARASTPPRVKTSQLIKMGALPIDIAVSAARLQMGEGAEEDFMDGLEGKRGGHNLEHGLGGDGEVGEAGGGRTTSGRGGAAGTGAVDEILRPDEADAGVDVPEEALATDTPMGSSQETISTAQHTADVAEAEAKMTADVKPSENADAILVDVMDDGDRRRADIAEVVKTGRDEEHGQISTEGEVAQGRADESAEAQDNDIAPIEEGDESTAKGSQPTEDEMHEAEEGAETASGDQPADRTPAVASDLPGLSSRQDELGSWKSEGEEVVEVESRETDDQAPTWEEEDNGEAPMDIDEDST